MVAHWSWPLLQMCERKRWNAKALPRVSSGSTLVSARRMVGSESSVEMSPVLWLPNLRAKSVAWLPTRSEWAHFVANLTTYFLAQLS